MKEKRIKFIASDLDGTLLLNGAQKVSQELIPLIKRLNDNGIIFCAASGRQYPNLKRLFGDVADDMMYICEMVQSSYIRISLLIRLLWIPGLAERL